MEPAATGDFSLSCESCTWPSSVCVAHWVVTATAFGVFSSISRDFFRHEGSTTVAGSRKAIIVPFALRTALFKVVARP